MQDEGRAEIGLMNGVGVGEQLNIYWAVEEFT